MIQASGKPITLTDLAPDDANGQSIQSLCGDNGKITSETGWKPTRRAEDALNDLCRSFQTQSFAQREPLHV